MMGMACSGVPTAIQREPEQVQYPAAEVTDVLVAHNKITNTRPQKGVRSSGESGLVAGIMI